MAALNIGAANEFAGALSKPDEFASNGHSQMRALPATTIVYDSYWRFAAERLAVYYRRLSNPQGPWTKDGTLRKFRFTNTFRASDRVSQYLIRDVQYKAGRAQSTPEVFFRTLLFKIFNRIDTWEHLETRLGQLSWEHTRLEDIEVILDELLRRGHRIYSAAYIMPSPNFGKARKHSNHLALLAKMMSDDLPTKIAKARYLRSAYELLLGYPGLGPFLAFQYTIDLNYSSIMHFDEADHVVAGPGALDGISKCFVNGHTLDPVRIINLMVDQQEIEFQKRGLPFNGLFGRPLQPIDCQNIFCEIAKYARVVHPEILGISGRTRIKQRYQESVAKEVSAPMFPPKWNIREREVGPLQCANSQKQFALFGDHAANSVIG